MRTNAINHGPLQNYKAGRGFKLRPTCNFKLSDKTAPILVYSFRLSLFEDDLLFEELDLVDDPDLVPDDLLTDFCDTDFNPEPDLVELLFLEPEEIEFVLPDEVFTLFILELPDWFNPGLNTRLFERILPCTDLLLLFLLVVPA